MITNIPSIGGASVASATNDIRGIKPPLEIPNVWLWVFAAVAVLLLVAAIAVAWYFWSTRLKKPPIIPVLPPHERARQKLREALALISQPRPFCILVSDTVRLYLEERFNFRAPERTTEEFLHELKATNLLLPDQKDSLGEFLSVCDMVKFAKYEPGPTELQTLHDSANRLVDETEPQPLPVVNATAGIQKLKIDLSA
jgi:hypothetical protein